MDILQDDSVVIAKVRELCAAITGDADYQEQMAKVETFLNDDSARESYKAVQEKGQELNQKQQAGLQLADAEVHEFEVMREQLMANPVATEFMAAEQGLNTIHQTVNQYVGMSLELGRVPTPEDFAQANQGGCCGGGGAEGGGGG